MNIKRFLKQMTIEDKARLLCGTTPFSIGGFEFSAGFIPEVGMQDGGTGINLEHLLSRMFKEPPKEYRPEEIFHVIVYFYDPEKLTRNEKIIRAKLSEMLTEFRGGIDIAPGCYPIGFNVESESHFRYG